MISRDDYKIVKHDKPVFKYGITWFYKIMHYESWCGRWVYLEDEVTMEDAEERITALISTSKLISAYIEE
jgi:hypothetical protein